MAFFLVFLLLTPTISNAGEVGYIGGRLMFVVLTLEKLENGNLHVRGLSGFRRHFTQLHGLIQYVQEFFISSIHLQQRFTFMHRLDQGRISRQVLIWRQFNLSKVYVACTCALDGSFNRRNLGWGWLKRMEKTCPFRKRNRLSYLSML